MENNFKNLPRTTEGHGPKPVVRGLPYSDPAAFVFDYLNKKNSFNFSQEEFAWYCLNQLQIEFNGLLNGYFNSHKVSFDSMANKLKLYLFFRYAFLEKKYQDKFKLLLEGISSKELKRLSRDFYQKKDLAQLPNLISFLYQDLATFINKPAYQKNPVKVLIKEKFDYAKVKNLSQKYKIINLFKEELKKIEGFIKSCFIHGSFATADFLEDWSDFDLMLIFNDKLFKEGENIYQARKILRKILPLFYQIDPLAHHYFQIITSLDLNYYPQTILPLAVYQKGLRMIGEREFLINLRDDSYERMNSLLRFVHHFKKRIKNPPRTIYQLKLDLAYLFLLPSLLLQTKGIYLYKKFSFARVKGEFPQLDFKVIDQATKIRKKWQSPNLIRYYPNIFWRILPAQFNKTVIYLYVRLLKRRKIKKFSQGEIKKLIQGINLLFEKSLDSVLNKK